MSEVRYMCCEHCTPDAFCLPRNNHVYPCSSVVAGVGSCPEGDRKVTDV